MSSEGSPRYRGISPSWEIDFKEESGALPEDTPDSTLFSSDPAVLQDADGPFGASDLDHRLSSSPRLFPAYDDTFYSKRNEARRSSSAALSHASRHCKTQSLDESLLQSVFAEATKPSVRNDKASLGSPKMKKLSSFETPSPSLTSSRHSRTRSLDESVMQATMAEAIAPSPKKCRSSLKPKWIDHRKTLETPVPSPVTVSDSSGRSTTRSLDVSQEALAEAITEPFLEKNQGEADLTVPLVSPVTTTVSSGHSRTRSLEEFSIIAHVPDIATHDMNQATLGFPWGSKLISQEKIAPRMASHSSRHARAQSLDESLLNKVLEEATLDQPKQSPSPDLSSITESTTSGRARIRSVDEVSTESSVTEAASPKPDREYVEEVRQWDVLGERGGKGNRHEGNKRYRKIVNEMKARYKDMKPRVAKTELSHSIVDYVMSYGGRFLKKDELGMYFLLTEDEARKKTSQMLRDDNALKWTGIEIKEDREFVEYFAGVISNDGIVSLARGRKQTKRAVADKNEIEWLDDQIKESLANMDDEGSDFYGLDEYLEGLF